jgi:thiol-disulfide isomerase/thioredoxin
VRRLIILIAILSFGFSISAQEVKKIKIEDAVEYIKNSDHPLIVSFWATWCAPCIHEIPWFQTAVEKYEDKKPELVLVSLDFTESYPKKITDFVKKSGFKATFFWLDEKNADHFCPMIDQKWEGGIPATLFINNKKNYRKFFDRQLTDRQVEIEVKALVDPPTP